MTTIERIIELMKLKGISAQQLQLELDLSSNAIYFWKSGRQNPSAEALAKIADYFNVSVDYLMGRTENKTPPNQTFVIPPELEGVGLAFEGGAKNLTQEDLNIVAQLVKTLQNKNAASKKDD